MKFILLLLVIIISAAAIHETEFSVHIKGKFLCHEKPYSKWPMDVFSEAERFHYDDYSSRFTKDDGSFNLKAWIKTDAYMITPYILIQHNCWESKQVPHRCYRKIIQPLQPKDVTSNSQTPDAKKVFDFGTVDLRFKHVSEQTVIC
ncbi:hypothetical protein CAEBREN_02151 [Caenorhabditis brenneri]|uniref:Uncharacterized protein n=1 Tax=Caenorhabditis brenneri TaxID=135651 RepID=G0NXZ7_CAEBE|nr:hypothetical protein CAEBREN_02151 [Caenorhabditis brenneri]